MEPWPITPFVACGPLLFGKSRAELHALLGPAYIAFAKAQGTTSLTDTYNELGVHLYYDDNGLLEFIEMFEPARPVYSGIMLLGSEYPTAAKQLEGLGLAAHWELDGCIFFELDIAFYEESGGVAVSVGRQGYFSFAR